MVHCWELVNLAKDTKVLHTKYKLCKRDAIGNVTKYKARFVVRRTEKSNDDEPSSSVADSSEEKMILCYTVQMKWARII